MTVRFDTRGEALADMTNLMMATPDTWQMFQHTDAETGLTLHLEPTDDRRHTVRVAWPRQRDGSYVRQVKLLLWPEHTSYLEPPRVYIVPDAIDLSRLLINDIDEHSPVELRCRAVA